MVLEGFFLVSVAANHSGDARVTLLHQGWKQASKKIQVPILWCTICDRGHRNNCCQEVFNAVAGIPDQEGITRTSGAKAKPPVFDHPSGGDGGAGRNYWPSFGRLSRSLGRQNLQPRLFYPALIAYIESCYLRLSFTRRGGPNTMNESNTALYDEDVLHGDEVPDAALELAGSKLWEGPAASFTLAFCSGLDTCPTSPRE